MQNQAISQFHETMGGSAASGFSWQTDGNPGHRLGWLFILMVIPVCLIAGRLIYLQGILASDFVEISTHSSVVYETIPAKDGRILAANGRVLATDVVRYDVLAHYRWLEMPADQRWLTKQAYSRLTPRQRRDRQQVETARKAVRQQRDAMWRRLSALTKTDVQSLNKSRNRVVRRIRRMIDSINRRRIRERQNSAEETGQSEQSTDQQPFWETAWRTVVEAVTRPPRRERNDPLVIPEQSQYHEILSDITREMASEIEANPELFPGLQIRISTRRTYPAGSLAAHLIGNRLPISAEEVEQRKQQFGGNDPLGYQPGDRIGKTGLEKTYDSTLRGRPGLRKIVRNETGEIIRSEVVRKPRAGNDIVLTVNLDLQLQMETLLDKVVQTPDSPVNVNQESGGCIVAIDVRTGEVLAAASAPRYDLNVFAEHRSREWSRLLKDPRRPLFPRATRMALPPGSVFKTLSAVALLESGKIDPDEPIPCRGYLDHPNKHRCYIFRHYGVGHGDTNLSDALCRSCNVYFFSAARKLGPLPFYNWAQRFGFGQPTGVDLPGERGGHLPSPIPMRSNPNDRRKRRTRWYPGDTLGLAIGQSRLTVTPFQVARMMAAVANDGVLVTPHVVRRVGTVSRTAWAMSETATSGGIQQRIPGLTEGTLERVREGLKRVVHHPRGTGYKRVRIPGITIAGKTGTAEVGGGKNDHAWFAGYVPAENPRIAFAVVLENAGSGGIHAGPVARQLVQSLIQLGIVRGSEQNRLAN
ncbi:MAG: hypothetical protein Tsb009_10330 [Planctomycetaceae bacterium]